MKKVFLFLMVLVVMLPTFLRAQDTLVIGTGTSTSYNTPFNSLWGYSFVEQIYFANEIITPATITAISFYHKPSSTTTDQTNNIVVYMKNVSRTSFADATDYEPVSAGDIVYSGSWTIPGTEGWTTITLNTPFDYDGSSNLMIAMHEQTSGYSTRYFTYTSTANSVISFHSDSADPDPYNLGSYTGNKYTQGNRANLKIEYTAGVVTCPAPGALAATNVTDESATLTWSPRGTETNWDIYFATSQTDVPDSMSIPTDFASDTFYNVSGLTSLTNYYVYVRANCGGGDVSRWRSISFRTQCPAYANLPIDENFDTYGTNSFPTCWTKISSSTTYPYTYSSAAHGGSYGLYFYQTTATANQYAYAIAPAIDPTIGLNMLTVRFDMKRTTEAALATLGVMSDPMDTTTFTAIQTLNLTTNWNEFEIPLTNVTATGNYLAIKCEVDRSSSTTSGYVYLDNFHLDYTPSCRRVLSLAVDENSIVSDGATITWVAEPGQSSWDIQIVALGDSLTDYGWITVQDTYYVCTNLNTLSPYTAYVRTNCGNEVSEMRSVAFLTGCGDVVMPYYETFENYPSGTSQFPPCWHLLSGTPYTYSGSSSYGGSGKALQFRGPGVVATPFIPQSVNELQISFQLKREGPTSGTMTVGFIPSLTDTTATMITIATITPADNDMHYYEYNLDNIGSTDQGYFVFQQNTTASNWYYWLDEVRINDIPSCLRPENVTITGLTASSATITWSPGGTESAWNVAYGTGNFNPDTVIMNVQYVTDTFVTIDNLTAGQTYTFYVQADCGSETSLFSQPVSAVPGIFKINEYDTLTTCSGILYDDGGASGNYSSDRNDQIVLFPATPGAGIQVSGTLTSESNYDILTIYDGVGTNGPVLFSGSNSSGMTVPPTYSSTALTIQFTSDGSIFYAGFALNVSCVSCVPPTPTTTTVGMDGATITWSDQDGAQSNWEFVYGPAGFNPDTVVADNVTSTTQILTNLTPNTTYDVYVRTICDVNDTSDWSAVQSFTTLNSLAATIPYSCDFEDPTESSAWVLVNGTCTNQWFIDTAANNTTNGTTGLYVSNDNGVSNNYSHSASAVWAYRDFDFTGYNEYSMSLDWKGYGESCCDYIRVYIGSPSVPVSGTSITVPAGATVLVDKLNYDSVWNTKHITLDGSEYNGTYRIYLLWRNDGGGGNNPAGAVDNISIVGRNCARPSNVAAQNTMAHSTDLTWHPATESDMQWDVVYSTTQNINPDTVTVTPATDTILTLSGLNAATTYYVYVRTNCGNNEVSSWTNVYSFLTECDDYTLPYTENFDNSTTNSLPLCWTSVGPYSTKPYVSSSSSNSSPNSLYMYSYGTTTFAMVSSPILDQNVDLSTQQVSFKLRMGSTTNQLVVGVLSDNTDASTFVAIDTLYVSAANAWEDKIVYLNHYTGTGHSIGFQLISPSGYATYLDDISVDALPTCVPVSGLTATNATTTSVDLLWSPASALDFQWDVVYSTDANFDPDSATVTVATDTIFTLNGLNTSSTYYAYVRTNCGNGDVSPWSDLLVFHTECDAVTVLPYQEDFNNYTTTATSSTPPTLYPNHEMPTCWTFLNMSANTTSYPQAFLTSYSSYAVSGNCLFFRSSSTTPIYAALPSITEDIHNLQITFTYRNEGTTSSNGTLSVGYMTDPTDASTFVELYACPQTTTLTEVVQMLNTIPSSVTSANIAFKYTGGSYSNYYASLDNVVVEMIPTCLKPTDLMVQGTTTTTATLSWTEAGTATAWDIEYGAQGFTPGTGTTIPVTTNPFTVTGLTSGTVYDFYVRANCGGGDESTWLGPVTATPGSYNMPTSGSHTVSMCGGVIYDDGGVIGNYSNSCDVTVVVNPDQTGLFVQLNGTYNIETGSSSRWDYLQIFDGSDNTGTILFDSHNGDTLTNITSTTGPLTLYFHSDASTTYSGFEIQVNCVSGSTPEPCNAPTNVTVSDVTTTSANVDWAQEGTPDNWTISYKKSSANSWTTVTTTTHPYSITNLEPQTNYDVYVTANCGDQTSTPSSTVTFVTQPDGVNGYVMATTLLYPNPTTGEFRIQNTEFRIQSVEVYDVYGKLIKNIKVDDNSVNIDLSENASGVYFTRIYTDEGLVTKRIVKK